MRNFAAGTNLTYPTIHPLLHAYINILDAGIHRDSPFVGSALWIKVIQSPFNSIRPKKQDNDQKAVVANPRKQNGCANSITYLLSRRSLHVNFHGIVQDDIHVLVETLLQKYSKIMDGNLVEASPEHLR